MSAPAALGATSTPSQSAKHQYTLFYRHGSNPYPQTLNFLHSSADVRGVIYERCKRHCEVMGYRFVSVRPTIVDLDKEENFFLNGREG